MSDIDRNDPLWVEMKQKALEMLEIGWDDEITPFYLIATRRRDEAVKQAVKALQAIRGGLCERIAEYHDDIVPKLESDLARYRADAERLDWVRTQKATVHPATVGTAFKWFVVAWNLQIEGEGDTVEAAIDAARAAEGTK